MENTVSKKYLVSIDGSKHSDFAFELAVSLMTKTDNIIVAHIFNKNKTVPFEYESETLFSKYETQLIGKFPLERYSLEFRSKSPNTNHSLADINTIAKEVAASVLLVGFKGHKQSLDPGELTKGIQYISSNIMLPVILLKEQAVRQAEKPINWLVPIQKLTGKAHACFEFALTIIDPEVDFVKGVCLYDYEFDKDLEEKFEELCKSKGITNFKFEYVKREKKMLVGDQIADIVNYGDEAFNFVVLGHNPLKYGQLNETPLVEIMKKAQTNILFKR